LHHAIYYKITDPDVSIRENGMNEKLSNAFPNPVHANSHLIIPVKTNDPHATIVISDIFGREVMKFSNINNEQQIIVDTSGLKEGLYLYSLQTGQQKLTKKFTVVR
jgi:hypothetical protein